MDIANRKQKKYPEKLFIELCILFLLIDSGNDVELFVLSNLFRKSLKTYKRYAEELSQCGITPELSLRMIDGERRFFFDCWDRGDYDIDQLLPEYISEHFHEEKTRKPGRICLFRRDQHAVRASGPEAGR